MKVIGGFELSGSTIRVGDPSLFAKSQDAEFVPGCSPGQWIGQIDVNNKGAVTYLCAKLANAPIVKYEQTRLTVSCFTGQMGLFDAKRYSETLVTPVEVPHPGWDDNFTTYETQTLADFGVFHPTYVDMRALMAGAKQLYTSRMYEAACDIVSGPDKAGAVETGIISQAGYGAGTYRIYVGLDGNSRTVAVALKFVLG